jgi:hypothetical protein
VQYASESRRPYKFCDEIPPSPLTVVSKITASPVRRSIAAKTISTRSRCRTGVFAARAAGVARFGKAIRGCFPRSSALLSRRRRAIRCRPLIWVSKSLEKLAAALTEMGHPIGPDTVRKELVKLGFSRPSNRKADEGSKHPDRNAPCNAKVIAA